MKKCTHEDFKKFDVSDTDSIINLFCPDMKDHDEDYVILNGYSSTIPKFFSLEIHKCDS